MDNKFRKSVKTAVPDDRNFSGALVLTKLVEWYRFGVGDEQQEIGRWTNICTIWFKNTPKLHQNGTEKRDAGGAQNWPRRFAPQPILGGRGVAFSSEFWRKSGVILTKPFKDVSIHSNIFLMHRIALSFKAKVCKPCRTAQVPRT